MVENSFISFLQLYSTDLSPTNIIFYPPSYYYVFVQHKSMEKQEEELSLIARLHSRPIIIGMKL